MHSHLHADDVGPVPLGARLPGAPRPHAPPVKIRPPWLIFLARHFAPRNHERYLMQGIDIPQEEWDRVCPPPTAEEIARLEVGGVRFGAGNPHPTFQPIRRRSRWLAFLHRHLPLRDE